MEWWLWLILILSGVLLIFFGYLGSTDDDKVFKTKPPRIKHHLDYDPPISLEVQYALKRRSIENQHSEWDKAFGPPYYYQNKEQEFMESGNWYSAEEIQRMRKIRGWK